MAKKITVIKLVSKPRNRVAQNPLLKKGGVHQKTFKALRKQDKQRLHEAKLNQKNANPKNPASLAGFFLAVKKWLSVLL